MRAFHNDVAIKDKYLARLQAHYLADEIIQGTYWKEGKGCAVGCTIHGDNHDSYEKELGIPILLAHIEDGIFEALPNELAKEWPIRFLEAINVGADLSEVWNKLVVWLLIDKKYGIINFTKYKETVEKLASIYEKTDEAKLKEWAELTTIINNIDRTGMGRMNRRAISAMSYMIDIINNSSDTCADFACEEAQNTYSNNVIEKSYEWRIAQAGKLIELLKEAK